MPEDNPLDVPNRDTDTSQSPTDNDAEAPVTVGAPKKTLPVTGAGAVGVLLLSAGLLAPVGAAARRRRVILRVGSGAIRLRTVRIIVQNGTAHEWRTR